MLFHDPMVSGPLRAEAFPGRIPRDNGRLRVMIALVMVPHAALKAFEPLEAFTADEQAYWQAYAEAAVAPPTQESMLLSREAGISGAIATLTAEREQAEVLEIDGRLLVCPLRTRLRLLASVLSFRRLIPEEVVGAFMPEGEADLALSELEELRAEHPDWRSHILLSTWEVPLRWFCAFDASERQVEPGTIRYRTPMPAARDRVGRALEVLRASLPDPTVVGMVAEVGQWLNQFHLDAILELDYGSVSTLLDASELAEDRSAEDIQEAVAALAAGEPDRAGAFYSRAAERWTVTRGRETTN